VAQFEGQSPEIPCHTEGHGKPQIVTQINGQIQVTIVSAERHVKIPDIIAQFED
jgi:hypothetical protein